MIEIKAEATTKENGKSGTAVSTRLDGDEEKIFQETLAVIKALMEAIQDSSTKVHLDVLYTILDNPEILLTEAVVLTEVVVTGLDERKTVTDKVLEKMFRR